MHGIGARGGIDKPMTDDPDVPDCSRLLQNLLGASIFRKPWRVHLEHPGTCFRTSTCVSSSPSHHIDEYHLLPRADFRLRLQKVGANLRHHHNLYAVILLSLTSGSSG